MIIQELIKDGRLVRQYSDEGYTLLQVETGIEYSDAVDTHPSKYTYIETANLIEGEMRRENAICTER